MEHEQTSSFETNTQINSASQNNEATEQVLTFFIFSNFILKDRKEWNDNRRSSPC